MARKAVEAAQRPMAASRSAPVATTRDGDFANVDELFRAVDGALRRAKDAGRNRIERFMRRAPAIDGAPQTASRGAAYRAAAFISCSMRASSILRYASA